MARALPLLLGLLAAITGCEGGGPQCVIDTDCPLGQRCMTGGTCQPIGATVDSGGPPSDAGPPRDGAADAARDAAPADTGVDAAPSCRTDIAISYEMTAASVEC